MELGNICLSMRPQQIHYAEATLSEMVVREVYNGNNPTGEYHLKPIKKINIEFLINFLMKEMPGVKIGPTDPNKDLDLEYPVYIKSSDRRGLILGIEKADEALSEFIKKRQKGGS